MERTIGRLLFTTDEWWMWFLSAAGLCVCLSHKCLTLFDTRMLLGSVVLTNVVTEYCWWWWIFLVGHNEKENRCSILWLSIFDRGVVGRRCPSTTRLAREGPKSCNRAKLLCQKCWTGCAQIKDWGRRDLRRVWFGEWYHPESIDAARGRLAVSRGMTPSHV